MESSPWPYERRVLPAVFVDLTNAGHTAYMNTATLAPAESMNGMFSVVAINCCIYVDRHFSMRYLLTFAQYGMTRLHTLDIKRLANLTVLENLKMIPEKVMVNAFLHEAC